MEISSLHKSISKMSDDESFALIRFLRDLRRQMIEKPPKKQPKEKKKVKETKASINQNILKMTVEEKEVLLQKLMKIKKRKEDKI